MMSLDQALRSRRSCRGFLGDALPRPLIEQILTAAQSTPSWCNTQPWSVAVFSGAATTALIDVFATDQRAGSDIDFPPGYDGVWAERRRESGWQLYEALGVARGDREASAREMLRNFEFFGAPHVAIVAAARSLGPYALVDCGLYVQSFLLAAQAAGVGTCAQAAVAMKSEVLRERIGWSDDHQIVCGIAFGRPDPNHPANSFRTHRADVAEVVTFLG